MKLATTGPNNEIIITPSGAQHFYLVIGHNIRYGSAFQGTMLLASLANGGFGDYKNIGDYESACSITSNAITVTFGAYGAHVMVISDDKDFTVTGN